MKCGIQLAKEVPVVFGGVNYPNWGLLKHHPNVTGFHDKIAFNENISVAKELFGEHVRLFTMLDTTYIDRQIRRDASAATDAALFMVSTSFLNRWEYLPGIGGQMFPS